MKRRYALPAVLGLLLAAILLHVRLRGAVVSTQSAHASVQRRMAQRHRAQTPEGPHDSSATSFQGAQLGRDLLRFADGAEYGVRPVESIESAPRVPEAPVAVPLRLVGSIRVGARVRAVLVVEGVLEVLEVAQETAGYVLLEVDANAGSARLRTPAGAVVSLEVSDNPGGAGS